MKKKKHPLEERIAAGEGAYLDFKFAVNESRKIAKSIVAFANSGGGSLLLGVRDNGAIVGVKSMEEKYMIETAQLLYCKPDCDVRYKQHSLYGKEVLEVMVAQSNVVHQCKEENGEWQILIRVEDNNVVADPVSALALRKRRSQDDVLITYQEEEKILFQWLESYASITLLQFCEIAEIEEALASDILSNLLITDTIEAVVTEEFSYYKIKIQKNR